VGSIYRCYVNNNPKIITKESAEINLIIGTHENSKSNDDVIGFDAREKTINFFPKGLDKFFKNLKLIYINTCQLKEIYQSDLKVFPNLVYFGLFDNDIEVIEEGLFDFNPNLEAVGFSEAKIIYIDPNVFDHLTKLSDFWFYSVPCIDQYISNSKEMVQEAIKIVKSKCLNSEFLLLVNQIKNLEIESKTLSSETFNTKLLEFENIFKISKFSKFRPLNYKFEMFKNESSSNFHQSASLDTKLVNHGENLKELITSGQNKIIEELGVFYNELKPNLKSMQKIDNNEEQIVNFETKMKEKFDKFEKELRHKLSTNFDEKVDEIEKRLIKKFEEKLGKIFNFIETKLGIE